MTKVNGSLNGNGHLDGVNGETNMSALLKERPGRSFISLFTDGSRAKRAAKIVAARDGFIMASQLLEKADEYATRAVTTSDETERKAFESIANEHLVEATKLREEAQAIVDKF